MFGPHLAGSGETKWQTKWETQWVTKFETKRERERETDRVGDAVVWDKVRGKAGDTVGDKLGDVGDKKQGTTHKWFHVFTDFFCLLLFSCFSKTCLWKVYRFIGKWGVQFWRFWWSNWSLTELHAWAVNGSTSVLCVPETKEGPRVLEAYLADLLTKRNSVHTGPKVGAQVPILAQWFTTRVSIQAWSGMICYTRRTPTLRDQQATEGCNY